MHSVHTHGPGCTNAAGWAGRVGAHRCRIVASPRPGRACARSCHSRVVEHRRRVAGRLLRAMSRVGSRRVAAPTRSCHGPVSPCARGRCSASYRRPSRPRRSVVSQPYCAILRHNSRPSATIQFLYRNSPISQAPRARAMPLALARGWPCHGSCWSCRGVLLSVSWPSC